MKTKRSALTVAIAVIGAVLLLALGVAAPAISKSTMFTLLAATGTPAPAAEDVIPLKSISGLTCLDTAVKINANGLIDGKLT